MSKNSALDGFRVNLLDEYHVYTESNLVDSD